LAEPENIVAAVADHFSAPKKLDGKRALVTAGPTYEAIDPVRFIGNHSSGKMGFALAEALSRQGAEVTLVSGPTSLQTNNTQIKKIDVVSADDMYDACLSAFAQQDIVIMAAAVADYRPAEPAPEKIKKKDDKISIELVKNPDILREMGRQKKHQMLVGFALETENEHANAREKLEKKNLDLIVLNSLRDAGAGFGTDTNRVTLFDRAGNETSIDLKSKKEVAAAIVEKLISYLEQPQHITETEKSL
ncbi:MAG: bifunctional phosphopantothenoylcysteine decarboxylase/phosphopantothenate--cysteine ligase CoaBC, partial [Mucilaginibacter polytrichastri]|nr:bifunctional phosphopantothenoylcysteine decarboxylase/phosphopantothenate--cysteine ligase CoaBC [Mucilaginibacter polytrichastri]